MNNFSIYHVMRLLVKNLLVIILSALIFAIGAFSYCKLLAQEKFVANGAVLVTNGGIVGNSYINNTPINGQTVNNSDITASINLLDTIRDILSTNDIYMQLAEELDGKYTHSQLKSFATISKSTDYSLFINVRFETNDPKEAIVITKTFLKLAPAYITKFIPNSAANVTLPDRAVKTSPQTTKTTVLAAFIGAFLAFAVFYIISLTNTTIKGEEDFKEYFNVPVLGDIPDFNTATGKYGKYSYKGGSYYGR